MMELKELLQERPHAILCGDFNIQSLDELDPLLENTGLRLINDAEDHTFPAHRPRRTIDLFLCSAHIDVGSTRTLFGPKESDHLPVLLDLYI
jgi:endonuclease/exonuclease/phosphatase family metal-dependent hydrolase